MIDDHSKACAIIPKSGKKPALEALQVFIAKVERQLGEKVRFIRSDNGVEFIKEANQWYRKKGIIQGNDGINTWKKFTGPQPNIPSILRFGSMCFVHFPKDTRSKASYETAEAVEGRLLGQDTH